MKLPPLHESVVLVDTEYLIQTIEENLRFYSDLYPKKKFNRLDLANILLSIASSAKIETVGKKINIVFLYKPNHGTIPFMNEPNRVSDFIGFTIDPLAIYIGEDDCTMSLASFYSDPFSDDDTEYMQEFCQMLRMAAHNPITRNILVVADHENLNLPLETVLDTTEKNLVVFRASDSQVYVSNPNQNYHYVNFEYVIGLCMGLEMGEL